ncbi:MAG: hypothetical protein PHF60_04785 [Candidatus ainarchaeum sp.]|nr:hypothetical protein [Candidatus ainarchaeum sp.]
MDDRYLRYAARIFLLVLLPFVLGAFILPHTQAMEGQMLRSPSEEKSGEEISYSFTHSGNDLAVPQKVNAIFPLADYLDFPPLINHYQPEICFQDNDSFLILADGEKYDPEFQWIVNFNNRTAVVVAPDGVNCTPASSDGPNEYRWYAQMALPLNDSRFKGNVTFVPQTVTYPQITMDYGLLQGLALIPVAFLFVWYPIAGIWKKVHRGILEQ